MLRKALISTFVLGALAASSPALAGNWGSPSGSWGKPKPPASSTSGGSTGGGTQVPEPGMLGMAGAGLIALAVIRNRRRKQARQ
ncbi:PEP-CTERM sorting domain-containing protein [Altererythrobacter sp. CC-YST694]|uniref:PEP-CTERM sorting domain-containing protein n=1 Tax=Altererythrobacter sp. CC-YST694 TaxID=2755038 RepID=UPI001D02A082|nr:PEP-CTERM sorting domain-containing protein [Altererythrobacter sp. CC-YST694]MCB5424444.1 PEP-CTERM sorting domain-containing protein [Altererythrobacter sp. CC-YST694]